MVQHREEGLSGRGACRLRAHVHESLGHVYKRAILFGDRLCSCCYVIQDEAENVNWIPIVEPQKLMKAFILKG